MENINLEIKRVAVQIDTIISTVTEQYENGDILVLDALLQLRDLKGSLDASLEEIKVFEKDNLDAITNEAEDYKNGYLGFKITNVNKKGNFTFKGIQEVESLEAKLKAVKDKYTSAFARVLKGTVQTAKEEDKTYWISADGEILPLPEQGRGSSYIMVKAV